MRTLLLIAFASGLLVGAGLVALRMIGAAPEGDVNLPRVTAAAASRADPGTHLQLIDPARTERTALEAPDTQEAQATEDEERVSGEGNMLHREDNRTLVSRVEGDDPVARGSFASGEPQFEANRIRTAEGDWILDGAWASFYENGQQEERGAYQHDRETGQWEWWYDNGQQMAVGTFVNGVREGQWSFWYPDGAKQMDGYYRDGIGSGRWVHWYPNGYKRAEGDYIDDELAGYWNVWDEEGALDASGTGIYEAGEKISD
jgi:hypothetical protein